MADYPTTLTQAHPAQEAWQDKRLVSYSRAGGAKMRLLQAAKTRLFVFEHRCLTAAERATLEAFYDANRAGTFNFSWANDLATVYVVAFADDNGLDWKLEPGGYWSVTIKLAKV